MRYGLSTVLLSLVATLSARAADKPNIVIFLADDLGYADIGVNGCKDVPTPNIDSIAAAGVRFTDGYANHYVCSPSRAGLMSGRYPQRFGFEHNSGPERYTAPNFGQPRTEPTLAERLKRLGYATGMVGKWHIGFSEGLRPHERGFDTHFGFLSGAHTYMAGAADVDPIVRNGQPVKETEYLTDAFAREASAFVDAHTEGPFFLYMAFNAVHSPLEATSYYQDRLGSITDTKRRTYAGMLSAMDDAIGRVLERLKAHKLEENTLVAFYADNGGPTPQTTSRNDPLRGYKAQFYEGGIRVPFLMQWKGKIAPGGTYREPVAGFDVHATALAAAGGRAEADKPLDGVDLLPYLTGQKQGAPHDRLFWRAGQQFAVRIGDYKLVKQGLGEPELYNLRADISETKDLSQEQPDKKQELQAAFDGWSGQMMSPQWIRQDSTNATIGGARKPGAGATTGRAGAAGGAIARAFATNDKDKDGKLSREEYPTKDLFDAIDTDKDGFATQDEVRAYYTSRQGPRTQP